MIAVRELTFTHSGAGWVNVTQDGVCGGDSPCIQQKIRPTRTQQKHHASDACGLSPWTVQTVVIPWNNQTEWKALGKNLLPLWVIQNTPARKKTLSDITTHIQSWI